MEMIGIKHSTGRGDAILGKDKSDVIDSEVLTHAGEIFDPPPRWSWHLQRSWHSAEPWSEGAAPPLAEQPVLAAAAVAGTVGMPDVWTGFGGSEPTSCSQAPINASGTLDRRSCPRKVNPELVEFSHRSMSIRLSLTFSRRRRLAIPAGSGESFAQPFRRPACRLGPLRRSACATQRQHLLAWMYPGTR